MSFLHPSSTKHRPIRRLPAARLRPVALAAASALGLLGAPLQAAGPAPTTLPNGLNVVHGQAQVATVLKGAAAQMTVRNSAGAILNWNSFSIGAQAGVHFQQADAASKVLNRVTGSDPSAIFGSLTSNGQVWLLNPNGVLFGAGSRVDVAGLVASTLRLSDNSFLDGLRSGRFSFGEGAAGLDGASVRNEGAIRTAHGGHLVMLSERVENAGTLDAPGGALLLAGAKAATLVDSALPYLAAVVPAGEVLNLGRAAADGGVVDVYAAVVNQQGLVRADTVAVDAQGRVVLKAADTLMLGEASRTSAAGTAEGSTGGRIDLLGTQVGLVGAATVDVSGVAGGGSIRLGGGLMGRDTSVANSRAVFVGPEALLLADATGAAGTGGSIILWSDEATRAWGRFSARGGSERGDGGFVETSGGWIDARPTSIDVTTRGGAAGTWLIDPNNLTISDTGPDTAITGSPSFTTTGDGAVITTATIATALNAGNSVTLTTPLTGGTEAGDIRMIGANLLVAPPSAVSLTLNATRDILVRDSVITSTGSPLSLNLVSAGGGVGAIEVQRSTITTAGGNVTLRGAGSAAMPLPDGTFTTALYSPAIGYNPATAPFPTALSAARHGVVVDGTTIDAGTGNFNATGLATASLSTTTIAYGVRLGPGSALVRVRAANINASGFGRTGLGLGLGLIGADLEVTAGMQFYGAGPARGVTVGDSRISLNAAVGSGAVLSIDGFGGLGSNAVTVAEFGVLIQNGLSSGVVANDGFLVANGRFEVSGRSLGAAPGTSTPSNGRGVLWLVDVGAAAPVTSDFRSATGVLIEGNSLNAVGAVIQFGALQLPTAAAAVSEFTSTSGSLRLETLTLTGGGNLTLSAAAGSVDPGDIQLVGSTFTFAPAAATTLLAQAARDIVVQGSTITSTGSPLNLDFQAAGNNAFGVVSISGSTLTTAGGNLTLGGTVDRALPLPGGGLTTATFRPARAYSTATGGASSALGGGQDAVRIDSSVITLGAGNFRAVGEGALDARDGIVLSSDGGGPMRLTAARVEIIGHSPAPTAVDGDRNGVGVGGQNTEITATQSILIQAAGDAGGFIESGARVSLAGSGSFVIDGYGGAREGVYLASYDLDTLAPGRGARITVTGGTLSVTGRSAFGGTGLVLDNSVGAPGPLLDLSAATGTSVIAGAGSGANVLAFGVDIVSPAAGSLGFMSPGQLSLSEVFVSGTGGALMLEGGSIAVDNSVFSSTAGPLSLSFVSGGAGSGGVSLNNTIIETRGGDVTFGDLRTVSSPILGATAVPANWIETDSSDASAALSIGDSVIDAGTGRIVGGGAVGDGGFNAAGLNLFRSVLTGSRIELAGRSDYQQGLQLNESTLNATSVLRLAGDSASNSPPVAYGVQIGPRSTLQLVAPVGAAGAQLSLTGRQRANGTGLYIEGGPVGGGNETRISIDNAAGLFTGTSSSGVGLDLRSSAPPGPGFPGVAGSGGVLVNASGASSLRLEGRVTLDETIGGTGVGMRMFLARVIGPQLTDTAPLDIVANGRGAVGESVYLEYSNLSSGGVTTIAANGIVVNDLVFSGDGNLNLYAVDQGASVGGISIASSELTVTGPGARVFAGTRLGGSAIGFPLPGYNNGIEVRDSLLQATGAGGEIELRGQGSSAGGSGVTFLRSPMTAQNLRLFGRGGFNGDGVFSDELTAAPSTLRTANLSINGLAANDPAATSLTRAGVVLGRGVVLDLASGGTALIEGDLIVLGRSGVATGTALLGFRAFGGPANFTVNATRSMQLREAVLDFSDGSGTAVTLRGDTDGVDGGRVRLNLGTQIVSGGGPITIEGQGALASVPALGLPFANVVAEGSTGVFLSGADLFAGSGVITLTGRGIDSGSLSGLDPGGSGILIGASPVVGNTVNARRVVLNGASPSPGFGVTIGGVGFTASNSITADEIVITGAGLGTFAATGRRAPGVQLLQSASLTGNLSIAIEGLAGTGVELQSATVVSLGSLDILGAGPVLSASNSFVSAEGALSIQGVGTAVENGVELGAGTLTRGDSVLIRGLNSAGARGVLLRADAGIGNITTYTGAATITAGSDPLGGAVAMVGRWILNPAGALNIESPGGLALAVGATSGLTPLFGGNAINLSIPDGGTVTYGPGGSIDAALFQAALPTAAVPLSLRVVGGGALEMAGSLSVAGRVRLDAEGGVEFVAPAAVVSTAPGDAIVIGGNSGASPSFVNLAGASALSTPAGRWVIFTTGPAATTLGGLNPAFSAYGLGAAPWGVDGAGDLVTPIPGNALGYRLGTADVSGAALSVLQTRTYDTTAAITLDPGSWAVSGLVAGDTLNLSGATAATMADKNVGVDKPVTADAAAVFSITDADGLPVFGYGAPALAATITPVALTVSGAAVSNKVYDAGVGATIASLGSVTPLAGDVVALGGTVAASFADKNVGSAKPVTATGFVLTGADAGNYTLVAPTGLTADITARLLAVTGVTTVNKVYDATPLATLGGTATIAPLGGDGVTLAGTASGAFADKNVGTAKAVTVSGYTLAGTDAGNYAIVQPAGLSATISAAPLAVTGLSAVSREYDRSTTVPLAGTAAVAPLAGDVVTLAGSAAGAFATAAAGTGKAVAVSGLALAGADAANYTLQLPTGLSADVTPRTLTLTGLAAAGRVYDAGTAVAVSGTLGGVLTGDTVGLVLGGSVADANVGTAKPVTLSAALSGADAGNYTLAAPGGLSADITPATLRYVAVPAFGTSGQALPLLTGDVSGFLGADTRASATTGTLAWTSPATAASPAGLYAVNGGGLAALNYLFVQDAANATALTLRAAAVSDPVTTTTTVVTTSALFSVSVPLLMSSPTEGRTLDVTPAFAGSVGAEAERRARIAAAPGREGGAAAAAAPAAAAVLPSVAAVLSAAASEAAGGLSFGALDFSRLPRDEIQTLLAARARYKKQVFADGIYRLQQDPTLADVRACRNEAETDTGQCLITEDLKRQIQAAREEARLRAEAAAAAAAAATAAPGIAAPTRPARVQRRVVQAALPVIERKLALLIGVNDYADKAVPQLEGAVRDSRAVRERLEQRLGYETTVLESPSRSEIVRAFNRLALEAQPGDSVIVYYAGHGVVVPVDGVETGFWLPADTDSKRESTWLSNADIGRLIAAIGSRQLMLVSDSCYSGTLVGKDRVSVSGDNPDEWLKRRAAVVMSSGGDEPVADEGKDGHSFFAWHFMRALEGLDRWQVGNSLHERLRTAVSREFPQTPQYGGSRGLGHESNTDFLFERRQIEAAAKAP